MRKATFVCYLETNPNKNTVALYSYRGKQYEIVFPSFNGCMVDSVYTQHQRNQDLIDEALSKKFTPEKQHRYEDTAQYGFDLFWNYVNS